MSGRRYSKEEKERYVEEFMNSEENKTAFAKARGIPESTFRKWVNYQKDNDITFGSIDLNNSTNGIEFSFQYQHINIELQKGFDKSILKKIMGVLMDA